MTRTIRNPLEIAADIFDPPDWQPEDRPKLEPHQLPPTGLGGMDWQLWLLEAGRGAGKTEACARYFARYMRQNPGARGRIIAPTFGDAVEACVEGPSGLKAIDPECEWFPSAPGGAKITWPNGSETLVLGTPFPKDVERLRAGGNRDLDWWEEAAANAQLKKARDQALLGLRSGLRPHAIASTTPRNTTDYREFRTEEGVVVVKATLFDNPHNPKAWREMMRRKYEGTRLGRQELRGELLDDVEGALWNRKVIEQARVSEDEVPELVRVVVSVDPAASADDDADDTGIIVVGLGRDGYIYVLADRTVHLAPDGWGQTAVRAYHRHRADLVVGERNNGGDMVQFVLATADPQVPYKSVWASRGKQTRAQPVAALYGDGKARPSRVKHVGGFPELEDQLCTWVPELDASPDRLDALVWAIHELALQEEEQETIVEAGARVTIGVDL